MKWYLKVMREHYSDFRGRARRSEYWMFTLFSYLFLLAGIFLFGFFGYVVIDGDEDVIMPIMIIFCVVFFLAHFIPSLSVQVRRLHDAGYRGWCILFGCIPYIGGFIVFILLVMDSVAGSKSGGPTLRISKETKCYLHPKTKKNL